MRLQFYTLKGGPRPGKAWPTWWDISQNLVRLKVSRCDCAGKEELWGQVLM